MTSTTLARQDPGAIAELALIQGDLSQLTPAERATYYLGVCKSLTLNPYTKPFEYLALKDNNGDPKLVLYARKDCTDQLRDIKKVSITKLERERMDGLYVVTAYAVDQHGRTDSAIGAVPIAKEGGYWEDVIDRDGRPVVERGKTRRRFVSDGTYVSISGEALANAIMKAETKAKRRVTLSLCGLGMTDESELDGIPNAEVVAVDLEEVAAAEDKTGESALEAWQRVSAEAKALGVEHKGLPEDAPETKVRRWTAALESKVKTARGARRYDEIATEFEGTTPPTAAEQAAPRNVATGEVLDEKGGDGAARVEDPAAAAAPPQTDLPTRAALWQENRRLVARASELKLTGLPVLNVRVGEDVLETANAELRQRIQDLELDQKLAAQQDRIL